MGLGQNLYLCPGKRVVHAGTIAPYLAGADQDMTAMCCSAMQGS